MNLRRAKFVAAFVVVGVLVVFGITFTASPTPKILSAAANKEESVVTKEKKILVVCYSFSCGNTRKIAKQLQVALNADYAEIEPVTPYIWSPSRISPLRSPMVSRCPLPRFQQICSQMSTAWSDGPVDSWEHICYRFPEGATDLKYPYATYHV